jgi:hypothetical protein
MYLEAIDQSGSPLAPYGELRDLNNMREYFLKNGICLYRFIYDSEGDGSLDDESIRDRFGSLGIDCVKRSIVNDFHPINDLRVVVERCLELLKEQNFDSSDFEGIYEELNQLLCMCDNYAESDSVVQLLLIYDDCE